MTTDTKAVRRWDFIAIDQSTIEIVGNSEGEYVRFTDHERVVGELKRSQNHTNNVLAHADKQIEALRDELETLNEAQAVCDGTIPIALLHWHQRALAAESARAAKSAEVEALSAGLQEILHIHANDNHRPKAFYIAAKAIDAAMEKGNV